MCRTVQRTTQHSCCELNGTLRGKRQPAGDNGSPIKMHSQPRRSARDMLIMAKDKGVVVSFRVDKHLADVLNKVPDKSAFIRDVILRGFYESCPVCRGRGVLPSELSQWAAKHLKADKAVECGCCLYAYPKTALPHEERSSRSNKGRFVCPHCQSHEHEH